MTTLFSVTDKIAVVTGGTGALGAVMCKTLAQAGATVIVMARNAEKTEQVADDIIAEGGQSMSLSCDVLDTEALKVATQKILTKYGRIDILINGAGGNRAEATAMPNQSTFFDLPEEALKWVFNLNMMGTLLPSQIIGKIMAEQGSGVIINISSMASMQPLTRVVAYSAAKAAINNFTQWLSTYMTGEYSADIRVNAIAPGFFLGEQNRFLLLNEDESLAERGQQIIDHTPMKRFGNPQDLDGTLLWLASDASKFVTGIVVPVDGGFSAFSGV